MKKVFEAIVNYIKAADKIMWLLCFACSGFSLIMMYSYVRVGFGGGNLFFTQFIAVILGIAIAVALAAIDYHFLADMWKIHVPLTVLLVLLTFTSLGIMREGTDNKAWLPFIGSMTLQPSELLKLSFILTFALHLSKVKENINRPKTFMLLCMHASLFISLIIMQGDDGSALVFCFIFAVMIFCAGLSIKYILPALALLGAGLPVLWGVMQNYQKDRMKILWDAAAVSDQQNLGRIAMGSGQMYGRGLFDGGLIYVPEAHNDFIFSYIGQTLGFIGCITAAGLLLALFIKIMMTAHSSRDFLGCYICVGVFAALIFQSIINIGMVLCVMPVIGVTLPLLSYGGTSVVTTYIGIGLVFSVFSKNRYSRKKKLSS